MDLKKLKASKIKPKKKVKVKTLAEIKALTKKKTDAIQTANPEKLDETIVGKFGHHVFGTEIQGNIAKDYYKVAKDVVKETKIGGKNVIQHAQDYIKKL